MLNIIKEKNNQKIILITSESCIFGQDIENRTLALISKVLLLLYIFVENVIHTTVQLLLLYCCWNPLKIVLFFVCSWWQWYPQAFSQVKTQ